MGHRNKLDVFRLKRLREGVEGREIDHLLGLLLSAPGMLILRPVLVVASIFMAPILLEWV